MKLKKIEIVILILAKVSQISQNNGG